MKKDGVAEMVETILKRLWNSTVEERLTPEWGELLKRMK